MNARRARSLLTAILFIALSCTTFSHIGYATGVAGSKHDLSVPGQSPCVYCHTPHNASTVSGIKPLWNLSVDTNNDFTPYSSATMVNAPAQPGTMSLLCLSCHDATIGEGSQFHTDTYFLTGPGAVNGGDPAYLNCNGCHVQSPGSGIPGYSDAGIPLGFYIGKNLSDDHPISFDYPTSGQDPNVNQPTSKPDGTLWIDVLPLYGTTPRMECPTCHDPHLPVDNTPFLRKANSGSALCLTCHNT